MNWLANLIVKGIREKAIKDAGNFQWSERERQFLLAKGYTSEQITLCEQMNKVGFPSWVERQWKG